MPAELFCRATTPSRTASRRASVVPLTVAVHAAAIVAVLIAPLVADVQLPEPQRPQLAYTSVDLPKEPRLPATAPTHAQQSTTAAAPTHARTAPLEPPSEIRPEHGIAWTDDLVPFGPPGGFDGRRDGIGPDGISLPPARPAPAAVPVHVGGVIQPPRKIKDVRPIYPAIAQQSRVQGMVVLDALIGADGRVQNVRILQHQLLLDDAAVAAVRQWVFEPTRLNGEAVPVVMTVMVDFRLN